MTCERMFERASDPIACHPIFALPVEPCSIALPNPNPHLLELLRKAEHIKALVHLHRSKSVASWQKTKSWARACLRASCALITLHLTSKPRVSTEHSLRVSRNGTSSMVPCLSTGLNSARCSVWYAALVITRVRGRNQPCTAGPWASPFAGTGRFGLCQHLSTAAGWRCYWAPVITVLVRPNAPPVKQTSSAVQLHWLSGSR